MKNLINVPDIFADLVPLTSTEVVANSISQKTTEIVENSDSKGLIQDYYNVEGISNNKYGILGRIPRFDPFKALDTIRKDPVVKGAMITLIDKMFEGGWRLEEDKEEDKKKLDDLRFNQLLKKLAFNAVLYNNAFAEIIGESSDIRSLNLLEVTLMKIDAEDNGDINGYFMYVGNQGTGKRPYWKPDKVTHFKLNDFTTNLWSELDLQTIYETVMIKNYAKEWLSWFFGTNQIRPVINIQGASNTKVNEFLSFLKASENNIRKPLVFEGEVEISKLQSFAEEGKAVLEMLAWCDEQILVLIQVPPVAVGKADQSGRSNSVELNGALKTRIKAIQESFKDTIDFDLFKKIGIDNKFVWGQGDATEQTQVFDNVLKMKQAQFTEEAIQEYMEMNGIKFKTEKVLEDPEEMMKLQQKYAAPTGGFGSNPNKSASGNSPNAPSRKSQTNTSVSSANKKEQVKNAFSYTNLNPSPTWVL